MNFWNNSWVGVSYINSTICSYNETYLKKGHKRFSDHGAFCRPKFLLNFKSLYLKVQEEENTKSKFEYKFCEIYKYMNRTTQRKNSRSP